jgi:hypothetical protein
VRLTTPRGQGGEPVTDDYPGAAPYSFTGGTIDRVAIDVSGEPAIDLEREDALMLMREDPIAHRCRSRDRTQ